jgi:hypothetical protein
MARWRAEVAVNRIVLRHQVVEIVWECKAFVKKGGGWVGYTHSYFLKENHLVYKNSAKEKNDIQQLRILKIS